MRWALALLFVGATTATCLIPRSNWPFLVLPYALAFIIYAFVTRRDTGTQVRFWLGTAIVARVILLFTFPNLSDDIYRFVWDGHLSLQGINPFSVVPSDYINNGQFDGISGEALLERMNSPDYYTVYPPLLQTIFAFAAWIGGGSVMVTSIVLKGCILLAELGTLLLMLNFFKKRKNSARVLIYALNPLVIVELVGNVHFEGFMIFGLILVITSISTIWSAKFKSISGIIGGLFIAVGSKLLPLITIPFLLRRMKATDFIKIGFVAGILITLSFLPVMTSGPGMIKSLNLYFQSFEFNASIYYVLRWLGYLWKGYNMIEVIGMVTAGATIVILLSLFLAERKPTPENLPHVLLFAFTTYFLFASVVHPWYICTLVMLIAFTQYRFAIAWSALAFLSYATYQTVNYIENYWLIALEYIIVIGLMIYELYREKGRVLKLNM